MKSFKSHDNSSVTFKFILTGLTALTLLLVIFIVFSVWYIVRKRREEKSRHSQHTEETFSERLASRSATGKSKIDVGSTSQQTLNQDREDNERRPTFSRFLKLWKGLRNSKRRSANEETRSVVFTIPTEDVFPKTHTRQQTYHTAEDPVTQTQLCDVHRVTHDIIGDYSSNELHQLDDDLEMRSEDDLDTVCENEITDRGVTTDITRKTNNESGSSRRGKANAPDRKTSDEKFLQGKEGKSLSKESDVDSGCGSSCHEIYASEPQITHAQLNVSSLVHCHAQKTGFGENKVEAIEKDKFFDTNLATSLEGKVLETKTEFEWCDLDNSSNEQCSQESQKSQVVSDSFEELIKLAKDGMSTLARKRVDRNTRKTISDYFQATAPFDTPSDAHSTNTDEKLQGKDASQNHSAAQTCLDARKVDSEVKCASSTSLCLETLNGDNLNMGKTLHCTSKENQSGESMSSTTCVVEIPTITVEPELVKNSLETLPKIVVNLPSSQDEVSLDHEVNNDQCMQDHLQDEINQMCTNGNPLIQKAVTFEKQNDLPLKIEKSFLNNGITEKTNRPKSLVLPSTNENSVPGKTMYGLKVTSLETLKLPSRVQPTEHSDGRIRAFSETIRRKLSFRERSSDDMDIGKQTPVDPGVTKNKKLKGFRSFRINKKKKTKALKTEEISQSTGCLDGAGSTKYWSTFDKIFHENTGSAIFSDVPFTIPEISE